jgi:hypothetical protein
MKIIFYITIVLFFISTTTFAEVGRYQLINNTKDGAILKIDTETGKTWTLSALTGVDTTTKENIIQLDWIEIPGEIRLPQNLKLVQ